MVRKTMWGLAALALMLAVPATISAQVQSWQEVQVGDIETMKDKWMDLAIAEANLFPGAWSAGA
jgi:hypothetical protein